MNEDVCVTPSAAVLNGLQMCSLPGGGGSTVLTFPLLSRASLLQSSSQASSSSSSGSSSSAGGVVAGRVRVFQTYDMKLYVTLMMNCPFLLRSGNPGACDIGGGGLSNPKPFSVGLYVWRQQAGASLNLVG
jgi:hypothetical protein